MKYDNQLRHAKEIIRLYDGRIPLAAWLKDYFKEHKQAGSRDRKILSALVYSWFRFGHHPFADSDERFRAAIALFPELDQLKTYFNFSDVPSISADKIFPPFAPLSEGVDHSALAKSILQQPDVFIRTRPGNHQQVKSKLDAAGIPFTECGESCLSVAAGTKLHEIINLDSQAVVQDKNSQRTGELMSLAGQQLNKNIVQVWDCCAASGGKSILAKDILKNIELTVSDKRESIIHNLKQRFHNAGIKNFRSFVADLTQEKIPATGAFDLVIADVPCSGSGTWSRTPEQLFYFSTEKLTFYTQLQKRIIKNVRSHVKPGAMLLYTTCSVFRSENEDVVAQLVESGFQLVKSEIFTGYNDKADTLYGALLISPTA